MVETSCGSFEIALDTERAPKTANSFAFLAEEGVYDDVTFHRIVPEFVIQGGDPEGNGRAAPATRWSRSRPPTSPTPKAWSRWRRPRPSRPGTSGSQFFVVTGADAGLPPEYALVGKVSEGMDVVERIGRLGTDRTKNRNRPS